MGSISRSSGRQPRAYWHNRHNRRSLHAAVHRALRLHREHRRRLSMSTSAPEATTGPSSASTARRRCALPSSSKAAARNRSTSAASGRGRCRSSSGGPPPKLLHQQRQCQAMDRLSSKRPRPLQGRQAAGYPAAICAFDGTAAAAADASGRQPNARPLFSLARQGPARPMSLARWHNARAAPSLPPMTPNLTPGATHPITARRMRQAHPCDNIALFLSAEDPPLPGLAAKVGDR